MGVAVHYVNGAYHYYTIINANNPASPYRTGAIKGDGHTSYMWSPVAVQVQGNYAYVTSTFYEALSIFDISSPSSPTFVGMIKGAGSPNYLKNPYGLKVRGNYAYIAAHGDDSFTVIDVSNPAAPSYAARVSGAGNYLDGPLDVFLLGDYAYVIGALSAALVVIDISTPTSPSKVGHIAGGGSPNYLSYARGVYVLGDYAYTVSTTPDHALSIFNISNPASPFLVGSVQGAGSPYYIAGPYQLVVVGDYAYIANNYLTIINVSNPAIPTFVGKIEHTYVGSVNDVKVSGDYAYVSCGGSVDCMTVIDVSNPANPTYVGKYRSGTYTNDGKRIALVVTVPPTVTSQAVTDILATTATGNGNITDLGDAAVTQHGVCWNTTGTPTTADSKTLEGAAEATGAFTSAMTELIQGTKYYGRAYAISAAGTVYGAEVTFTTLAIIEPTVRTNPATSLEKTTATLNGTLDDDGREACDCGFEYGETTAYGTTTPTESKETGEAFSQAISGLTPGKHYHFRAIVTNSAGTSYGSDRQFFAGHKGGNPNVDQRIYQHMERIER